jgi:hypothetical protein
MLDKQIKELEELCKPVAEYLKKNWDPHCTVVITDSHIRLVRDEMGIPVRTAQEVPVQEQPLSNFSSQTGEKLNETCPKCWIKNKPYKCGFDKCPGHKLLVIESASEVPVQEQHEFVPEDSNGVCKGEICERNC